MDTDANHDASTAIALLSRDHPLALKKKKELDYLLQSFETGKDRCFATQQALEAKTQELGRHVAALERIFERCQREMPKTIADVWERRLRSLRDDLTTFRDSLKIQLNHIYHIREDEKEKQRRLLLSGIKKRETAAIEEFARERRSLRDTGEILDAITQQGRSIVTNLFSQNQTLKKAQRKLFDMRNSLTVSSSLVGIINRRHAGDRIIVYSSMVFTIVFFGIVYYYFHFRSKTNTIANDDYTKYM